MSERLYVARRTFDYDETLSLDRGQCFDLRGYPNDEKLIRLGYVEEHRRGDRPLACGRCGAKFMDDATLNQHGRMRHEPAEQSLTPTPDGRVAEDVRLEQQMQRENQIAPLYLDKASGKPLTKRGPGRPRIHP